MAVMQFRSKAQLQRWIGTHKITHLIFVCFPHLLRRFQANTALTDKESIVKAEAAEGDATVSGPRAMVEDEVRAIVWHPVGMVLPLPSTMCDTTDHKTS